MGERVSRCFLIEITVSQMTFWCCERMKASKMIMFGNESHQHNKQRKLLCVHIWEEQSEHRSVFIFSSSDIQFHVCNFPFRYANNNNMKTETLSSRMHMPFKKFPINANQCNGWCQMNYITELNPSMLYNWTKVTENSFAFLLGKNCHAICNHWIITQRHTHTYIMVYI